jgi:hypothetical protein
MSQTLAANAGQSYFNTAFVADDAAMFHALVLTAQALPVGYRTKNTGAEQAVALRLKGSIVNGLRLSNFTM